MGLPFFSSGIGVDSYDNDDPTNIGEKLDYDKEFKGPVTRRRPRDLPFLLLFLIFLVAMVALAVYAWFFAKPELLYRPKDSNYSICGVENVHGTNSAGGTKDLSDYPYLYFHPLGFYETCVEECPKYGDLFDIVLNGCAGDVVPICAPGKSAEDYWIEGTQTLPLDPLVISDFINDCGCPYPSDSVLWRCVPTSVSGYAANLTLTAEWTNITEAFDDSFAANLFFELVADVFMAWPIYIFSLVFACILSYIFIILVRFFVKPVVWSTIFLVVFMCLLLTFYFYFEWWNIKRIEDEQGFPVKSKIKNTLTMFICGIVFTCVDIVLIVTILFMAKRIMLTLQLIKEASSAVLRLPLVMFFPTLIFGVYAVFLMYWVIVLIGLLSAQQFNEDCQCMELNYLGQGLILFHVFGLFWVTAFLYAVSITTIAGGVAKWYWSPSKKKIMKLALLHSFKRVMIFHLGSMAFGSLILAIVKFIRFMVKVIEKKTKGQKNQVQKWIFRILKIVLFIVDKILKYITRNAYIEISIYGYGFLKASKKSFQLIFRNILRVSTVNIVGDFILFLGKVFIALSTVLFSCLLCQFLPEWTIDLKLFVIDPIIPNMTFWILPCLLCGVVGYLVAKNFMAVYEIAIDTLLVCFCEDEERNDGSDERPYYARPSLRRYIDLHGKSVSQVVQKKEKEHKKALKEQKKAVKEAKEAEKAEEMAIMDEPPPKFV